MKVVRHNIISIEIQTNQKIISNSIDLKITEIEKEFGQLLRVFNSYRQSTKMFAQEPLPD